MMAGYKGPDFVFGSQPEAYLKAAVRQRLLMADFRPSEPKSLLISWLDALSVPDWCHTAKNG
jgi:hypothetical protein